MDKFQRKWEIITLCDRIRDTVSELKNFESTPKENLEQWAERLLRHIQELTEG
jgi:hypothetical protein